MMIFSSAGASHPCTIPTSFPCMKSANTGCWVEYADTPTAPHHTAPHRTTRHAAL